MTGQYHHSIDNKGRLFIPARLREELGETFYVAIGMGKCLAIYSDECWAGVTAQLDSLPYSKTRDAMRMLYANAVKCEPDAQGRILLPAKLRQFANLSKNVAIIGVSKRAEIWDEDTWNEMENAALNSDAMLNAMEELGL